MIGQAELSKLKMISIVEYLASLGIEPDRESGAELCYFSPLRIEFTPSFFVNPVKNVFHDFGETEFKGDIIRLIQLKDKVSFPDACHSLRLWSQSTPEYVVPLPPKRSSDVTIVSERDIKSEALKKYISNRQISFSLAAKYLREVQYTSKGRKYFALGFKNCEGGYELRNKYFKGCSSPKGITAYTGNSTGVVSLFEGMFDFLSALEYYKLQKPSHNAIVLNSTSLIGKAIPQIKNYSSVNCFLDNDNAAKKIIELLKNEGLVVTDFSNIYYPHKDFNDFLCSADYAS